MRTRRETAAFGCPVGWEESHVEGARRPKKRWLQRDGRGREVREFLRREELERALEREV